MADDAWKTTFEVKHNHDDLYDIINIHSGQVVGTYKFAHYAKKQARRKYKKLVKLVDKFFTSKA